MKQNLCERRERYELQIRKESIGSMLKKKRQESENLSASKQLVNLVHSEQFDELIPFLKNIHKNPQIWRPDQQDILFLNQFLQANPQLNLIIFRCMAYANCVTPSLSHTILQIWSKAQIIDCLTHCFLNNTLQINQLITPQLLINKALSCQQQYRQHYTKLFLHCYSYMHQYLDKMVQFVPHWLNTYDQNLIKLLICLSQNQRRKRDILMVVHKNVVGMAREKAQAFQLLMELVSAELVDVYPQIREMIRERMEGDAEIRYRAVLGALKLLRKREERDICWKIIEKYGGQHNGLVKGALLEGIILMVQRGYVEEEAIRLAEFSIDGLFVPQTSFITITLNSILSATQREKYLEIYRGLQMALSHLVNNPAVHHLVVALMNRLKRQ